MTDGIPDMPDFRVRRLDTASAIEISKFACAVTLFPFEVRNDRFLTCLNPECMANYLAGQWGTA